MMPKEIKMTIEKNGIITTYYTTDADVIADLYHVIDEGVCGKAIEIIDKTYEQNK